MITTDDIARRVTLLHAAAARADEHTRAVDPAKLPAKRALRGVPSVHCVDINRGRVATNERGPRTTGEATPMVQQQQDTGRAKPRRGDLSGQRFGLLTVISEAGRNDIGKRLWLCQCDCGGSTHRLTQHLRSGRLSSCGCLHRPCEKHGMEGTPTYCSWSAMRQRCTNPNEGSWENYGGRGITVCDRWLDSFAAFLADMGERPDGLTIDRIDNDGNYEPGNCRWATYSEQNANQRPRRRVDCCVCGTSTLLHDIRQGRCSKCRRFHERYGSERPAVAIPQQFLAAAKRIGLPIDQYMARRDSGQKWCCGCKAWHPTDAFGLSRNRADGLSQQCREWANARLRARRAS